MAAAAIETERLTKDYAVGFWRPRPYRALDGLSLRVDAGEVFGFLGPNGAGKSTTLKLLMGLIFPTEGTAQILGRPDHMDEPEALSEFYYFNVKRPPVNDVRVRKAFNLAIDKVALAQVRRVARPLTGFVPEGVFPGYPHPAGDPFDPARARALLAEAGYRNAQGEYDPSTFPVDQVELTYNTQESNRMNAEFTQAQRCPCQER